MVLRYILLFALLFSKSIVAQTSNENFNSQIQKMKESMLSEDYVEFSNFVHPKVKEMAGGKKQLIEITKNTFLKMKQEGFYLLDINYSDPTEFIYFNNEVQITIVEELLLQTPKAKILGKYMLIGISNDNGNNWTFINTSRKSSDDIKKFFPNLSPKIQFKPSSKEIVK
ncbi:hypothetical protein P3875_06295 [Myroides sp. JBRI-B21084]|uniref:hypothetical protein n=1 Tax=Myroides sp. JBRI-B21084 TaxID=3119977 RepID=UPI0026E453B0|nr:hypothetical protein [Paenimyroides cloacae]WKW45396.1 hypothetical protein P3875_06295 [Paenimyroides cloacae]